MIACGIAQLVTFVTLYRSLHESQLALLLGGLLDSEREEYLVSGAPASTGLALA